MKFIWENYGQIRSGRDLAKLTIELNKDPRFSFRTSKIIIDAGSLKIEDET